MQGKCSEPFPVPSSVETDAVDISSLLQKPAQCLVLFSCTLGNMYCPWYHLLMSDPRRSQVEDSQPAEPPMWLDNVLVHAMGGGGSSIITYRDLWITNVTLQWNKPHTSNWPGPLWAVGNVHVQGTCPTRGSRQLPCKHTYTRALGQL